MTFFKWAFQLERYSVVHFQWNLKENVGGGGFLSAPQNENHKKFSTQNFLICLWKQKLETDITCVKKCVFPPRDAIKVIYLIKIISLYSVSIVYCSVQYVVMGHYIISVGLLLRNKKCSFLFPVILCSKYKTVTIFFLCYKVGVFF